MIESAELILGQQTMSHLRFYLGDSVDQLQESVANELMKVQVDKDVLVLTDMFSGSPQRCCCSHAGKSFTILLESTCPCC